MSPKHYRAPLGVFFCSIGLPLLSSTATSVSSWASIEASVLLLPSRFLFLRKVMMMSLRALGQGQFKSGDVSRAVIQSIWVRAITTAQYTADSSGLRGECAPTAESPVTEASLQSPQTSSFLKGNSYMSLRAGVLTTGASDSRGPYLQRLQTSSIGTFGRSYSHSLGESMFWRQGQMQPAITAIRSYSTDGGVNVREKVESINSKFAEAREEIDLAMEAKDTVFFNEEALGAKTLVEEVLEEYKSLLNGVDEQKRGELQRSMGMKMEQLKAEAAQLDDASS